MKGTPELKGLALYHAVRATYPRPCRDTSMQGYCVGGALEKFIDAVAGAAFPTQGVLIKLLMRANPALSELWAFFYAGNIIRSNDSGDYGEAWDQLKAALIHGGTG